jgi:tRNA G18 (ribose-2'-O)-methylase SpoU
MCATGGGSAELAEVLPASGLACLFALADKPPSRQWHTRPVAHLTPELIIALMRTRCPNPNCQHEFEVLDEKAGKNGPCSQCGQIITFRPLNVILEVERRQQRHCSADAAAPGRSGGEMRFSAALEDIRSLWNVGSIFRSADGAGFSKLYLCGITGTPPAKAIAKTSLGAENYLSWEHCANALHVLPQLTARGVQVVGLEQTERSIPLREALTQRALRAPLCLVVGNEVAGLSAEALGCAEIVCRLPMRGNKTSLNVAVAFGIAAYRITEQLF